MGRIENADTRYFIEIDLATLEVIRVGFDQKNALNQGHQDDIDVHKLFLSKGQYDKFTARCENEILSVLDN
jgi:hypothetical protein